MDVTGSAITPVDTDGSTTDGEFSNQSLPDYLDLDSDGDGVFDLAESGLGLTDADTDGRTDGTVGANGLDDSLDTADNYVDVNGSAYNETAGTFGLADSDGDTNADGSNAAPTTTDFDYRDTVVLVNVCGDGNVAGAESCDDGNTANGDGCSDACLIEVGTAGCTDVSECVAAATGCVSGTCVQDTAPPVVVITAPTTSSTGSITDTTVMITDDNGVLVADVAIGPGTTAGTSMFSCVQTSASQVDCTIQIDSSGDLEIVAQDTSGNAGDDSEPNYVITPDTMPPVVTIDVDNSTLEAPVADDSNESSYTVTGTCTEGISDVTVAIAGAIPATQSVDCNAGGTFSATFDVSGVPDGDNSILITVSQNDGDSTVSDESVADKITAAVAAKGLSGLAGGSLGCSIGTQQTESQFALWLLVGLVGVVASRRRRPSKTN
ncbi:MAG: DUF4215 domain-containing protein [Polyangiales bacterium]